MDPRQPVLVGAAQLLRFPGEPLDAMAEVAREALPGRLSPDLVAVVDSVSWAASDPGAALAGRLGLSPRATARTGLGGSAPQALVNRLAGEIAGGGLDCALIAGAEAVATLMPHVKAGTDPGWSPDPGGEPAWVLAADDPPGSSPAEEAAGLIAPIFFYPLIEHAIRRAARRTREEHLQHIAALWSRFSAVAAENPYAWSPQARSTAEIATPSPENRLVSDPYTKLLNANITVDMAAALVLCSAGAAQAAGVPRDRWVFPWAGAHGNDHWNVSEREELHRSPAIAACGESVLAHAGVAVDDVAHIDLYSCFPSAVEIAAYELGLDLAQRTPSLTGGLTFAGGPGNNYATHAIATLYERLRADPEALGLTTALSWYVTKHAIGVYGGRPPSRPYRAEHVSVDHLPRRTVVPDYRGDATVEAYTALYERDGSPGIGIVAARLPDGRRTLVRVPDASELVGDEDPLAQGFRVERVLSG